MSQNDAVLAHVHRMLETSKALQQEDVHLLDLFLQKRDEEAFTELVRRHGPLVLGVCRRVLRNPHDADDVFQATFLVFARKADSIRKQASLPSWLHGVAYRLSLKCRAGAERCRQLEHHFHEPEQVTGDEVAQRELRAILDEELQRLPERQRAPILLCYADGKSQDQAARAWLEPGTLKRRLERGREILRSRLTRRGLALSASAAVGLTPPDLLAAVPPTLAATTIKVATLMTAPEALAATAVSAKAVFLAQGLMKSMAMGKLKMAGAMVLLLGLLGSGGGVVAYQTFAPRPGPQDVQLQPGAGATFNPHVILAAASSPAPARSDSAIHPADQRQTTREFFCILGHKRELDQVALAGRGSLAITNAREGAIAVWDSATGRELHRLPGYWGYLAADDRTLVTQEADNTLRFFDAASGKEVRKVAVEGKPFFGHALSPDGKTLSVGSRYDTIRLHDAMTGKQGFSWTSKDGWVGSAFSSDGKLLIAWSINHTGHVFDLATGRELRQFLLNPPTRFPVGVNPQGGKVAYRYEAAVSADGRWIGYAGNKLQVLNTTNGQIVRRLDTVEDRVGALAFSPDGKTLACAAVNSPTIHLLELATGKERHRFTSEGGRVLTLAFSIDGKRLISGKVDTTAMIWDLSGKLVDGDS